MNVQGRPMRTIWLGQDGRTVEIIDQTRLPHELVIIVLRTLEDAARAIGTMQVRGAPLIGAAAAYGVGLGSAGDPSDTGLESRYGAANRPTVVNLRRRSLKWATLIDVLGITGGRCLAGRRDCGGGCRDQPRHRRSRRRTDRGGQEAKGHERAGRCSDALQCRLARHRRLGHRTRPDLSCA